MKRITLLYSVFALLFAATACTSEFESYNTDPNAAQVVDQASLITTMELDAAYPTTGETTVPVNRYQTGWNLLADHYAGYMACANHFDGGSNPMVYNLTANNWSNTVFEVAFTQVMPAWLMLKAGYDEGLLSARTDNNRIVNFPGPLELVDRMVNVRITDVYPHTLGGVLVE